MSDVLNLYIVRDVPLSAKDNSCYMYVVKAKNNADAINIVRKKTNHKFDLYSELADNSEVWE